MTSSYSEKNVLPHGRSTKISKATTDQQLIPSSTPLVGIKTSFWVCGSVYVNFIVLFHVILCDFFN